MLVVGSEDSRWLMETQLNHPEHPGGNNGEVSSSSKRQTELQ